MAKSKLTAREKSRQERERTKSSEDRSRLMKKAAQLQQNAQHERPHRHAEGGLGDDSRVHEADSEVRTRLHNRREAYR
jgi:hypothetical protein